MEKSELVRLIEEPIFKAYKRPRNIQNDHQPSKNKMKTTASNSFNSSSSSSSSNLPQVSLSEAQRDRRTVFVQQLSVKCGDRDLLNFFTENGCPTRNARIVLDKYTRKSKGVAYVEFYEEESVKVALKLTGNKLLGIPVIVELTETEKNRIAQEACNLNSLVSNIGPNTSKTAKPSQTDDLVRLYIGALHPSLTESELRQLFDPFGQLESVELLKDERSGVSKGVAFVQYKKPGGARMALEALNGFELAGKAIRVGPVRIDKSKLTTTGVNKPSEFVQKTQQDYDEEDVGMEEEENIIMDAKKRAELMQKLLSSRK